MKTTLVFLLLLLAVSAAGQDLFKPGDTIKGGDTLTTAQTETLLVAKTARAKADSLRLIGELTFTDSPKFLALNPRLVEFTALVVTLSDSAACHICKHAFLKGDSFVYYVTKTQGTTMHAQFAHFACTLKRPRYDH